MHPSRSIFSLAVPAAALVAVALAAPFVFAQTPELAAPEAAVLEPMPAEAAVVTEPPVSYDTWHAPAPVGQVCCPIAVVDSRIKLSARRAYRCAGPPTELTICVANPVECDGPLYSVPLCVPCCCVGEAQICNPRPGLLPSRGKVDVVWDCGFVATVTFLKHGGVIITYTAA